MPQDFQFLAEGEIGQPFGKSLLIEQGLNIVMTQIGHDRHDFDGRIVPANFEFRRNRQVQGKRRTIAPGRQREAVHRLIGQHGDLVSRHIHGRQPGARHFVKQRTGCNTQSGRCNMYADTPANTRQFLQGKCIVDLGGRRVVNRKGLHIGMRQVRRRNRQIHGRKIDPAREMLEQKALKMKVMRRTDAAALFQQMRRRKPGFVTGRFQRLGFRAIAIGLVEQLIEHWPEFGRQSKGFELGGHALDG